MIKLINDNSIEHFKNNDIGNVSLVLTSPSYFTEEPKRNTLDNEIGVGETKEEYTTLIYKVLESLSNQLVTNGKIVLVIGRYNDLPIESIIYMLEDKLNGIGITLSGFTLHGKGEHEAIVVFNKGNETEVQIPEFYKLQIYDREGFFGRINPDILDWAIMSFTEEDDLIVDPFAGAGNTLTRASKYNRRAYGVELNPKFI